jgi:hypothetical protein
MTNTLIGFLGLLYLFKTAMLFLKDKIYAIAIPLFIFTSPIYVFYTNNFMPDATCLSIAFIGIYNFFKYYFTRNKKFWYYSMLFLLLAGLVKTPSLIFFLAAGAIGSIDLINGKNKNYRKIYPSGGIFLFSFLAVFGGLIVWYAYAYIYSDLHGGSVSPIEIRPIWILSSSTVEKTWEMVIGRFRSGDYHSPVFLIVSGIFFCANLIVYKWYSSLLNLFTVFTFLGAVGFTALFFRSMQDHDYYQTGNLGFIPFVFLNLFVMLKNRYPKIFNSAITKSILSVVLILLINDCRINMSKRYSDDNGSYYWSSKKIEMYGDLEPYLRKLGIKRTNIVYCTPDQSINISLYLINQKGFTDFGFHKYNNKEQVNLMLKKDLKYVIVGDRKLVKNIDAIEPLFGKKIGQFGTTEIFQVPD